MSDPWKSFFVPTTYEELTAKIAETAESDELTTNEKWSVAFVYKALFEVARERLDEFGCSLDCRSIYHEETDIAAARMFGMASALAGDDVSDAVQVLEASLVMIYTILESAAEDRTNALKEN